MLANSSYMTKITVTCTCQQTTTHICPTFLTYMIEITDLIHNVCGRPEHQSRHAVGRDQSEAVAMLPKFSANIQFTITPFVVAVGSDKPVELAYVTVPTQNEFP